MSVEQWGAGAFGAVIGWFAYYTNRYRKGEVQFSDLATFIGIIGGGAVTTLFGDGRTGLFAAYGIGLAAGFFAYFVVLLIMVANSKGQFTIAWFLDGRRKKLDSDFEILPDTRTTTAPMSLRIPYTLTTPAGASMDVSVGGTSQTPLESATAERDRAIQSLVDTIQATIEQINKSNDNAERERLRAVQNSLNQSMQEIVAARLHDIMNDPKTSAALAQLKQVTADMQKASGEIKSASDFLTAATGMLQKAGKVIGFLTGIFGG